MNQKKLSVVVLLIIVCLFCCPFSAIASTANTVESDYSETSKLSNANSVNKYAGVTISSDSYKGISAYITVPYTLPDIEDSEEFAFVSTNKDDNGAWVQVGAAYCQGYTSFITYFEHFQNGVYSYIPIGTHIKGAQIFYKVEYNASDGKWHAYIGNVDRGGSTLTKVDSGVQANAEVHKDGIEMGPFTFSTVKIKTSSSAWINNIFNPTYDSPYSTSGGPTQFTASGP